MVRSTPRASQAHTRIFIPTGSPLPPPSPKPTVAIYETILPQKIILTNTIMIQIQLHEALSPFRWQAGSNLFVWGHHLTCRVYVDTHNQRRHFEGSYKGGTPRARFSAFIYATQCSTQGAHAAACQKLLAVTGRCRRDSTPMHLASHSGGLPNLSW